jgi:hypothetical protein
MSDTVRAALARIGIGPSATTILNASFGGRGPRSLRRLVDGTANPRLSEWRRVGNALSEDGSNFASSTQGVATDGLRWFVGSNSSKTVGIYGFDGNRRGEIKPSTDVWAATGSNAHFGPPSWTGTELLVPVQQPDGVWMVAADLATQEWWPDPTPAGLFSWIAREPGTGLLFTSIFDTPPRLEALAARTLERTEAYIEVPVTDPPLDKVQGGAFTRCGRLLLACNDEGRDLFCYSALNGHAFGAAGLGSYDEVEGLDLLDIELDGTRVEVHVLDTDDKWHHFLTGDGSFWVHSYSVPDPMRL